MKVIEIMLHVAYGNSKTIPKTIIYKGNSYNWNYRKNEYQRKTSEIFYESLKFDLSDLQEEVQVIEDIKPTPVKAESHDYELDKNEIIKEFLLKQLEISKN